MNLKEVAAIKLAIKYYDEKTLIHALRVANLAVEDAVRGRNYKEDETTILYCIALLHDILEDTSCSIEEVMDIFSNKRKDISVFWGCPIESTMKLLTHEKNVPYSKYMENILSSRNHTALIVKRADLKDHFLQKETLTDELMKKYLP